MIRTIEWKNDCVVMIDQRLLPTQEEYNHYSDYRQVARAIKDMVIRGAPAIGVAAALGIALGMRKAQGNPRKAFDKIAATLAETRPTAVNLFWAIERMRRVFNTCKNQPIDEIGDRLLREALAIREEDIQANIDLGKFGAKLLPAQPQVLTHCNAGALATAGYGTALGVVRSAHEAGKKISVLATETRPFLQGARLTAWELKKEKIPVKLITDNMAGHFMSQGEINCVVVGADRIAANGDVANKIGTYSLAILAKNHGIPFYVAAPCSTVDLDCPTGASIPIEDRHPKEVSHIGGKRMAPTGIEIGNPAFDVTPSKFVTAIITDRGVVRRPYGQGLKRVVTSKTNRSS